MGFVCLLEPVVIVCCLFGCWLLTFGFFFSLKEKIRKEYKKQQIYKCGKRRI